MLFDREHFHTGHGDLRTAWGWRFCYLVCMVFAACRYEEDVKLILESFNDGWIYSQTHKFLTFKPVLRRPPRKTKFHLHRVNKQLN